MRHFSILTVATYDSQSVSLPVSQDEESAVFLSLLFSELPIARSKNSANQLFFFALCASCRCLWTLFLTTQAISPIEPALSRAGKV